jgi:hypothetical protein
MIAARFGFMKEGIGHPLSDGNHGKDAKNKRLGCAYQSALLPLCVREETPRSLI